ncbi:STAS-like domain-containing protein [Empedobacter falsenii]
MIINIAEKIGNTSSNEDGTKLFEFLKNAVEKNESIIIEINPGLSMSSSFLNTSIGYFLDNFGKEMFFKTVKFKGSKKQFERLNDYLVKYIKAYEIN